MPTVTFKDYLVRQLNIMDLGLLKCFLGIEVARNGQGIFLCQQKYVLDILFEFGMLGRRPYSFPMEQQHHHLGDDSDDNFPHPELYRRLVGCFIYFTITQSLLCYSVYILS